MTGRALPPVVGAVLMASVVGCTGGAPGAAPTSGTASSAPAPGPGSSSPHSSPTTSPRSPATSGGIQPVEATLVGPDARIFYDSTGHGSSTLTRLPHRGRLVIGFTCHGSGPIRFRRLPDIDVTSTCTGALPRRISFAAPQAANGHPVRLTVQDDRHWRVQLALQL